MHLDLPEEMKGSKIILSHTSSNGSSSIHTLIFSIYVTKLILLKCVMLWSWLFEKLKYKSHAQSKAIAHYLVSYSCSHIRFNSSKTSKTSMALTSTITLISHIFLIGIHKYHNMINVQSNHTEIENYDWTFMNTIKKVKTCFLITQYYQGKYQMDYILWRMFCNEIHLLISPETNIRGQFTLAMLTENIIIV